MIILLMQQGQTHAAVIGGTPLTRLSLASRPPGLKGAGASVGIETKRRAGMAVDALVWAATVAPVDRSSTRFLLV